MSSIVIAGDTSGSVTLQAPAVAGSTVITLPSTSTTLVSSQWTTTGSDIYYNTGNVGIGTTSPAYKLDVSSGTNTYLRAISTVASDAGWYFSNTARSWITFVNGADGAYRWYDATANAERMRIDTSGNLGIGTSSPSQKLDVTGFIRSNAVANGGGQYTIAKSGTTVGGFCGSGNWTGTSANDVGIFAETGNAITLYTNGSGTEKARIDTSGRLLIGSTTSSDSSSKLQVSYGYMGGALCIGSKTNVGNTGNGAQVATNGWLLNNGENASGQVSSEVTQGETSGSHSVLIMNRTGSNGAMIQFRRSGTGVGAISVDGSSTTYSTSSDYRLKNTITPMTGALAKVAQLKPVTYKWNIDGSDGQGFIAHELAEVVPQCVTGQKDETRIEEYEIIPAIPATFDEQGNELTSAVSAVMSEREVPVYQGIDTSFLVATLTAAIQEQQALITALTQRITALEGA